MNFKPGDKVVYARPWEGSMLKTGGVYTVKEFFFIGDWATLVLSEHPTNNFSAFRFDLLESVGSWDANGSPV